MRRKASSDILAELAATDDGLRTKRVGEWTLTKLANLLLYFQAFTTACSKKAGESYYVDGFAGPGLCRVRGSAPTFFAYGSPALSLRTAPTFSKCIFLDLDETNIAVLKQRTAQYGQRALAQVGDVNSEAVRLIRQEVPAWAPCFVLLDQQGGELNWATIESIAGLPRSRNKPELMILFPLRMALLRMLSVGKPPNPEYVDRWDNTFGNGSWRDIFNARLTNSVAPGVAQRRYLDLYMDGIRRLGYRFVQAAVVSAPTKAQQRRNMYHLVFATDSEVGNRIMTDVFRRPYSVDNLVLGRPRLFE